MNDAASYFAVEPTAPFLFVGNDSCLDFLNTSILDQGRPVDLIQRIEDLLRWLVAAGFLAADAAADLARRWDGSPEAASAVEEARALRARLLAMVDGMIAGRSPSAETIAALNAILARRVSYEQIAPAAGAPGLWGIETRYAIQKPRDLLAPLAQAAATLLSKRDPQRIKACENPACVLHYYDTSKNGSRRWCDTRTCGNRIRVAHHYQRQHAHAVAPGASEERAGSH